MDKFNLDIDSIRDILRKHKEELKLKYKVREIGIFGSFARGEQTQKSDIDILVDFEETPDLLWFINMEEYLGEILGAKVDLVRKPVIRKELRDVILNEVKMI